MGLKDRIRRVLTRSDDRIAIPLEDGQVEHFTPEEMEEAFLRRLAIIRGEGVEPHPANVAAARSSLKWWRDSVWACEEAGTGEGVEDLSHKGEPRNP